jgi:hypothetical protein
MLILWWGLPHGIRLDVLFGTDIHVFEILRENLRNPSNSKCGIDLGGLFSHFQAFVDITIVLGNTPGSGALGSNETVSGMKHQNKILATLFSLND